MWGRWKHTHFRVAGLKATAISSRMTNRERTSSLVQFIPEFGGCRVALQPNMLGPAAQLTVRRSVDSFRGGERNCAGWRRLRLSSICHIVPFAIKGHSSYRCSQALVHLIATQLRSESTWSRFAALFAAAFS